MPFFKEEGGEGMHWIQDLSGEESLVWLDGGARVASRGWLDDRLRELPAGLSQAEQHARLGHSVSRTYWGNEPRVALEGERLQQILTAMGQTSRTVGELSEWLRVDPADVRAYLPVGVGDVLSAQAVEAGSARLRGYLLVQPGPMAVAAAQTAVHAPRSSHAGSLPVRNGVYEPRLAQSEKRRKLQTALLERGALELRGAAELVGSSCEAVAPLLQELSPQGRWVDDVFVEAETLADCVSMAQERLHSPGWLRTSRLLESYGVCEVAAESMAETMGFPRHDDDGGVVQERRREAIRYVGDGVHVSEMRWKRLLAGVQEAAVRNASDRGELVRVAWAVEARRGSGHQDGLQAVGAVVLTPAELDALIFGTFEEAVPVDAAKEDEEDREMRSHPIRPHTNPKKAAGGKSERLESSEEESKFPLETLRGAIRPLAVSAAVQAAEKELAKELMSRGRGKEAVAEWLQLGFRMVQALGEAPEKLEDWGHRDLAEKVSRHVLATAGKTLVAQLIELHSFSFELDVRGADLAASSAARRAATLALPAELRSSVEEVEALLERGNVQALLDAVQCSAKAAGCALDRVDARKLRLMTSRLREEYCAALMGCPKGKDAVHRLLVVLVYRYLSIWVHGPYSICDALRNLLSPHLSSDMLAEVDALLQSPEDPIPSTLLIFTPKGKRRKQPSK